MKLNRIYQSESSLLVKKWFAQTLDNQENGLLFGDDKTGKTVIAKEVANSNDRFLYCHCNALGSQKKFVLSLISRLDPEYVDHHKIDTEQTTLNFADIAQSQNINLFFFDDFDRLKPRYFNAVLDALNQRGIYGIAIAPTNRIAWQILKNTYLVRSLQSRLLMPEATIAEKQQIIKAWSEEMTTARVHRDNFQEIRLQSLAVNSELGDFLSDNCREVGFLLSILNSSVYSYLNLDYEVDFCSLALQEARRLIALRLNTDIGNIEDPQIAIIKLFESLESKIISNTIYRQNIDTLIAQISSPQELIKGNQEILDELSLSPYEIGLQLKWLKQSRYDNGILEININKVRKHVNHLIKEKRLIRLSKTYPRRICLPSSLKIAKYYL